MQLFQNELENASSTSITLFFDTRSYPGLAPDGFGTRVQLTTDASAQLRYLDGGTTYLAQSELSVHFGLGAASAADIEITYANGHSETLTAVRPGRYTITARPCTADFFPDGELNIFDILEFLAAFSEQHPQTDLTGDGEHNIFDVLEFLSLFETGCPS